MSEGGLWPLRPTTPLPPPDKEKCISAAGRVTSKRAPERNRTQNKKKSGRIKAAPSKPRPRRPGSKSQNDPNRVSPQPPAAQDVRRCPKLRAGRAREGLGTRNAPPHEGLCPEPACSPRASAGNARPRRALPPIIRLGKNIKSPNTWYFTSIKPLMLSLPLWRIILNAIPRAFS